MKVKIQCTVEIPQIKQEYTEQQLREFLEYIFFARNDMQVSNPFNHIEVEADGKTFKIIKL